MNKTHIDLHCHPSLKPYGNSFKSRIHKYKNSTDLSKTHSIWHIQRPKIFRKRANVVAHITKWRQSDFATISKTGANVVVVSLYPMEKGMVFRKNGKPVKAFGRVLRDIVTGISLRRIRYIQNMKDYFGDLTHEYQYYLQLHNKSVMVNGQRKTYKLVSNAAAIDYDNTQVLHVILSIEGAHVFNSGLKFAGRTKADESEVLKLVDAVKHWEFKPFFIGLAHHFDNELCGFSKSFSGLAALAIHQNPNPDVGILPLGFKVIDKLLDNSQGNRILIDLKHMNPKARYAYYELLESNYKDQNIPLIVSHGALNGKLHPITHNKVWKQGFNTADINFYFDEIQKIERSKGIFGIQLDERRIYNAKTKNNIYKRAKKSMTKFGKEKLRRNSYFIWRQIEYIAVYLDTLDRNAWDIQALGTDFDGIIDPLNGWWSAQELPLLSTYLEHHANDFIRSKRYQTFSSYNQLSAAHIVEKFMFKNAQDFINTYLV